MIDEPSSSHQPTTSANTAQTDNRCYDIGILFVHGIGRQRRGETLTEFGDAIIQWLERWSRNSESEPSSTSDSTINRDNTAQANIAVIKAIVDDQVLDPTEPAYAQVSVTWPKDTNVEPSHWLMAEAWWAESFVPPSFRELALWGLQIVPWTILAHFGVAIRRIAIWIIEWAQRLFPKPLALVVQGVGVTLTTTVLTAFALGLSVVTLIFVLILLILALLPIPGLREVALRLQELVAAYLGDSYVLLLSPVRAGAIISRVRHSFDWLAKQCHTVAVIAHSQGGAIAHMALRQGIPDHFAPDDVLFVTFGSGLGKLESLRRVITDPDEPIAPRGYTPLISTLCIFLWWGYLRQQNSLGWLYPAGMLAIALIVVSLAFWALWPGENRLGRKIVGIIVAALWIVGLGSALVTNTVAQLFILGFHCIVFVVCLLSLVEAVVNTLATNLEEAELNPEQAFRREVRWLDLYAGQDPVANGALYDQPEAFPQTLGSDTLQVDNRASMLRDHTTYWQNQDGFVGFVACGIADLLIRVKRPPLQRSSLDVIHLELARFRRRWRTRWMVRIRWGYLALCAVIIAIRRDDLVQWGHWTHDSIAGIDAGIRTLISVPLLQIVELLGPMLTGALGVLLGVFIALQTIELPYRLWEHYDTRALFRRKPYSDTYPRLFFYAAFAWVVIGLLVSVSGAPRFPSLSASEIWRIVGGFVGTVTLFWLVGLVFSSIFREILSGIKAGLSQQKPKPEATIDSSPQDKPDALAYILLGIEYFLAVAVILLVFAALSAWKPSSSILGLLLLVGIVGLMILRGWLVRWLAISSGVGEPISALRHLARSTDESRLNRVLKQAMLDDQKNHSNNRQVLLHEIDE